MSEATGGRTLLERDDELASLHGMLAATGSSGGRVVLVRGEAGIGKSALMAAFVGEVADRAHVLFGECDDLLTPQPFGPIWDLARDEPSLAGPLGDGDRRAVMETVLDLLARRLRPTIVVIEDVQWADEATLDLTRFLGRRIDRTQGLLLLTYRDGEVDTTHPLRLVIGAIPPHHVARIPLRPLSREAVAVMVPGHDLDEVMRLSGGNPLLVTEISAAGTDGVPASIRDSVLGRVAGLPGGARRLLDVVAVCPGGIGRGLLERIVAPTPDEVAVCERAGLLRSRDTDVAFRHELVRRAVESALDHDDRRLLHQRILDALDEHADPAVVVHHAHHAGDVDSLVEAAPRAARAAMATESHREALTHFRTLDPHLDRFPLPQRAALLEDRARIERHIDLAAAGDTIARSISLYRASGRERDRARAQASAVEIYETLGRHTEAAAAASEAVAILRAPPSGGDLAEALGRQAWLAFAREDDLERAVELADEAIAIAEAHDDGEALGFSLHVRGSVMLHRGDASGFADLERSQSVAEAAGDPRQQCRALGNLAYFAAEALQMDWVGDLQQRARDVAGRAEIALIEAHQELQLAWMDLNRGRYRRAEATLDDLLARFGDPAPSGEARWPLTSRVSATIALATLQLRRGLPAARSTLDCAWSLFERVGWPQFHTKVALAEAEYRWTVGAPESGTMAILRTCLDREPAGCPATRGRLATWMWRLGGLEEIPERIADPYHLLITGSPAEAAALLGEVGLVHEQALALMHGGEADRREALEILDALGATGTAARLRRMLRDAGVRVPRGKAPATRDHPAGLTARQAEVLDLLAEGRTSPQIADHLFISPRTAENHVAAIFTKLGVTDRHDAVTAARDLGLLGG